MLQSYPKWAFTGRSHTKLRLAKVEDETSSKAIRIYNYDVK